ncbi:hypothetical protein WMF27_44775 [Sorangium sp. So ce281]
MVTAGTSWMSCAGRSNQHERHTSGNCGPYCTSTRTGALGVGSPFHIGVASRAEHDRARSAFVVAGARGHDDASSLVPLFDTGVGLGHSLERIASFDDRAHPAGPIEDDVAGTSGAGGALPA